MSVDVPPPTTLLLELPDLTTLLCVTLSLQRDDEQLRSKHLMICRELLLLHPDVLSSPSLDSLWDITAVMAVPFFHSGVVQSFAHTRRLQLGPPRCVFPGDLQCCLSYSLITRLSPLWNKAGLYLIKGSDFLSERGRLSAVSVELNTTNRRLCISIKTNSVRLPPITLPDLVLCPSVLQRFLTDPDSVMALAPSGGGLWCHVLPSMKKGQMVSIRRRLPSDGPFRTLQELQNHWSRLYGYTIPDHPEVYCSVHFRLLGDRLFTYPLSCVRLQPVQCCAGADLQGALSCFLTDVHERLRSVCGAPAKLSWKPCCRTAQLQTAGSVEVKAPRGAVLTQVPPPSSQRPLFGSQPTGVISPSQQEKNQDVQVKGRRTHGQIHPSSTSFSILQPGSSLSSSSSEPLPPVPSPTPEIPPPTLVPIFSNKNPSGLVNMALLKHQLPAEVGSTGVALLTPLLHPQKQRPAGQAMKRLSDFTPTLRLKHGNVVTPNTEYRFKPTFKPKRMKSSGTGSEEVPFKIKSV